MIRKIFSIMLQKDCKFCRGRDIMDVVPDCSPDITKAIDDGFIENKDIPAMFNQIEAFEDVGQRAKDVFDMVSYQNAVKFLHGEARKKAEKEA